jgi:uncharacterized membrane protein
MGRGNSQKDNEPEDGNSNLIIYLTAIAGTLAFIFVLVLASLYPDSLFTKILIYAFIGVAFVGFLFRRLIVRLARRM